jgi:nucleotide-binding universal stress UspA family protein
MRPLTLRTVLAATDVERSSDAALDSAYRLAKSAGAALHVVHVVPWMNAGQEDAKSDDNAGNLLRHALRRANVPEGDARLNVIPGSPDEAIRSLADRMAADVIVLGPHRTDDRSDAAARPLGGTAQAIVAHTFAPCLVTPVPLRLPLERVLVPIDLSETARGALLVALSWASALRGRPSDRQTTLFALHIDSVGRTDDADSSVAVRRELDMLEPGARDWAGVDVRAIATHGADVAETIARHADDQRADLVVVGTRGLGADEAVRLGSVSAALVQRLELPMLLVPPGVWRAYAAVP